MHRAVKDFKCGIIRWSVAATLLAPLVSALLKKFGL